ncbi:GGDEF domain-containing protein [Novosphingobium sp. PC22D]|uniref:GGDEF domain-containing protein n=1 Tax=Novosphingobium sp. PC22D TaxID=1962403 RepID=UPI000BEFB423|nr:GGDEF domain-containing protein [Novosphingobium sp. PC22D]PEQ13896.1 GGDEF domain-containing protein [Novosphingobium sp. PC22D]
MSGLETSAPGGGFLRWLGLGQSPAPLAEDDERAIEPEKSALTPRERRRRQLIEDIGSFLVTHNLEVSGWSLGIAYEIMTGRNPRLSKLVERRVKARHQITLEWLEDAARTSGRSESEADLFAMMGKIEAVIDEFATTASAAKTATHEYNSALEASVSDMGESRDPGEILSQLAKIARDMLARTREVQTELARSEAQTLSLQKCLADARKEAEIDHLTGLPNRRAFEAVFKEEIEASRQADEPLCVAFCDIDHFKRINDTHGHEAGDRVLRMIANTLAKLSEDKCHVARHGGEEFVILLRGWTMDQAWTLLDDARRTLASRRMVNRSTDIPFGQITFSAGIAEVHRRETPRHALKAADEALYAAKESGRNRVVRADMPTQPHI